LTTFQRVFARDSTAEWMRFADIAPITLTSVALRTSLSEKINTHDRAENKWRAVIS
jgi:hypothetical protein